jgi:nitrogenase molybdenum-iron protein alpha/beta subunit
LGEKNNSYFLGLEKQRQVKKSISKLLDENNKVIKEQGEILSTIKDYYEKLYTSKKTDEISSKESMISCICLRLNPINLFFTYPV